MVKMNAFDSNITEMPPLPAFWISFFLLYKNSPGQEHRFNRELAESGVMIPGKHGFIHTTVLEAVLLARQFYAENMISYSVLALPT